MSWIQTPLNYGGRALWEKSFSEEQKPLVHRTNTTNSVQRVSGCLVLRPVGLRETFVLVPREVVKIAGNL